MRSKSRMYRRGSREGIRSGWLDGWRLGACDRVLKESGQEPPPIRKARVLYVAQNFEAIDWGVEAALHRHVSHVCVSHRNEMTANMHSFKPDAVLVMNGLHKFPDDHLKQVLSLRNMGIKTAVWFADDPYMTDDSTRHAPYYEYVFTQEKTCVPLYTSIGCRQVFHLPLAVWPDLFRPIRVAPAYRHDVVFIGNGFWNRIRLFDEIAPYLQDKKVFIAGHNWERLQHYPSMARFIRAGWTEVPETVHFYNGAKIVINLHRTNEPDSDNHNSLNWPGESVNPRTFEIAASGAFQLSDLRSELPQHYAVGSEIGGFENAEQLVGLINHYLKHDEERLQIAVRGYARTIRRHSFSNRIPLLLDAIGIR